MNQPPNFDIYIGKTFLDVKKEIESKFGGKYYIQVLKHNFTATCDYKSNRIRIYLDDNDRIEIMSIG